MSYFRKGSTLGGIAIFVILAALQYAPVSWRLPGAFLIYLSLTLATLIECFASPQKIWSATRKAAECGCNNAMIEVGKLPGLLQKSCANCGAEMA